MAAKVARFVFINLDRSRENVPSLGSFSHSWKIYFPTNSRSIFENKPADKVSNLPVGFELRQTSM